MGLGFWVLAEGGRIEQSLRGRGLAHLAAVGALAGIAFGGVALGVIDAVGDASVDDLSHEGVEAQGRGDEEGDA